MNEHDNDVPMIPKHQSEMEKMHLTHMNSSMCALCIGVAILLTIVVVVLCWASVNITKSTVEQSKVFVDNYTMRTDKWLSTLLQMQSGYQPTEVLNEKVSSGYVQQLPIP